jgi:hypothetical protein
VSEITAGEGITDVEVVIEVGEWRDVACVGGVEVDDDAEPESEFAEPDGEWVAIDTEDRAGEDIASALIDGSGVAGVGEQVGNPFECANQESAGSAGGIEDRELLERVRRWAAEFGECAIEGFVDECWWGEEGAEAFAFIGGHEGLEGAAEHGGIDGGVLPGGCGFVGGEAESTEDVGDEGGEWGVGEAERRVVFEWGACEESAVEERDLAEVEGGGGAVAFRGVEGAEAERIEQAAVDLSAVDQGVFEVVSEELAIVIEPAFGFEEGEEEESADGEEGEFASGGEGDARIAADGRGGRCEVIECCGNALIEAVAECVAPECIEPALVGGVWVGVVCGGEEAEGVGV